MKLIDFDKNFEAYTERWFNENKNKFNSIDEMEVQMPEVYFRWSNTPFDWLDNQSPSTFFYQYHDPEVLVNWMMEYFCSEVPLPDLLVERIKDLGDAVADQLLLIVEGVRLDSFKGLDYASAQMTAISLLNEMQSIKPMNTYIDMIKRRKGRDELADHAAEALINMGVDVIHPILQALEESNNYFAQECFIDILTNFPGYDKVFSWILKMFQSIKDKKALYASYLGKYGDERAIPVLEQEIQDDKLSYLDYVEIKNAIEELGGAVDIDRDFTGDYYYNALKNMD